MDETPASFGTNSSEASFDARLDDSGQIRAAEIQANATDRQSVSNIKAAEIQANATDRQTRTNRGIARLGFLSGMLMLPVISSAFTIFQIVAAFSLGAAAANERWKPAPFSDLKEEFMQMVTLGTGYESRVNFI